MGYEKKKWYQTGEFEDGYQFGDIFRTIKNSVKTKKEKSDDNSDKPILKDNQETKKINSTNTLLRATKDLNFFSDPAAQIYGFANEKERQNYIMIVLNY